MPNNVVDASEFAELNLENAYAYLTDFMRMLWRSAISARRDLHDGHVTQEYFNLRLWRVRDFEGALDSFHQGRYHHAVCYIDIRIEELTLLLSGDIPDPARTCIRSELVRARMWQQYLIAFI